MPRIDDIFAQLRQFEFRALMPYIVGGYPRPGALAPLLKAVEGAGASIVQIGFPFADSITDGPVILQAMHKALASGAAPTGLMDEVRALRASTGLGLVAVASYSIVHRLGGPAGFCRRAADSGFDGLVVPDVTLEESGPVREAAARADLSMSLLVAPTTTPQRAAEIARACTGFVSLTVRAGAAGEAAVAADLGQRVAAVREATRSPIACGGGLSTASLVRGAVTHADAAVVGGVVVRRMADAQAAGRDIAHAVGGLVQDLSEGLSGAGAARGRP
ncbi:MAG TPA: tryptophan synthase subunit alpha [Phycisphaerales bacterium]|nr:tryptophan synthase subunit alpha [Phycisphaerales bacterium]